MYLNFIVKWYKIITAEMVIMEKKNRIKTKKKIMLIWISAFVILAVASYVLIYYPEIFDKESGTVEVTGSNGFYDYFYEADYSLKLEEYEDYSDYLDLDRALYYKNGNQTVGISKSELASYPDVVRFFGEYFDAVIKGDTETYNSLFSDEYYKTHEEKENFTPQMVYNMMIEQLSVSAENGFNEYVFDVSYKIFENNGTFRDDIYSNASRTQRITVDDSEGDFRISSVKYYVTQS